MYARNYHSYTHFILALGIVRKSSVWVFITSKYPGIHDIGLPIYMHHSQADRLPQAIYAENMSAPVKRDLQERLLDAISLVLTGHQLRSVLRAIPEPRI